MYALSCNLSDADLSGRRDLVARGKQLAPSNPEDDATDVPEISGSEARLKWWNERHASDLGQSTPDSGSPSLIDCIHKVMQLWKTGEQARVNAYLEERGLWKHEQFTSVIQAVLEWRRGGLRSVGCSSRFRITYGVGGPGLAPASVHLINMPTEPATWSDSSPTRHLSTSSVAASFDGYIHSPPPPRITGSWLENGCRQQHWLP